MNAMTTIKPQLSSFRFGDQDIRVVNQGGEPWFIAVDTCRALGLSVDKGAGRHLRPLTTDEVRVISLKRIEGNRGNPNAAIISESGLYKLVMRSDKWQAKPFQDWVTRVVLPAIRKDGGYIMGEEKVATGEMTEDQLVMRALEAMQRKVARLTETNKVLSEEYNLVSVAEFVASNHVYLAMGERIKLAFAAKSIAATRGGL